MPRINHEENMRATPDSATLLELRVLITPELINSLKPLLEAEIESLNSEVSQRTPYKGNKTERQTAWVESLSPRDMRRLKYHAMLNIGYKKQAREFLNHQYTLANPPRSRGRPAGSIGAARLRAIALGNVVNQLLHAVPRAALRRAVNRATPQELRSHGH